MASRDTIFPFRRLKKGKFRNARFFIFKDGSTEGGRKTVTHEYINSDRRFVEDLGKKKEIYSLEIYVDTNNGFNDRDNLKRALNQKGTGKLVHPFYGSKTVSVKGWTAINKYGFTQFNVNFEESDPSVLPQQEQGNKSLLDRIKEQIKNLQESKIGSVFNVVGKGFKTFQKGVDKVNEFSEELLEVSNAVVNVTSELGELTNTINDTLDNVALLVKTPSDLGERVSNLFTQFALIGERVKDQFDATKGLFGFGSGDTDTKENTANQRTIKLNNDTINIAVRSNALALAYQNATDLDYNNNEELQDIKGILEDEYQNLILIADDETLELLRELRSQAELIFDQLEKTVPKIYIINLNSYQNIHQIVFEYYGNFANSEDFENKIEDIWNLNNFTNPSKIRGEVKLLTA
jgi:prophage DNA circulation protein